MKRTLAAVSVVVSAWTLSGSALQIKSPATVDELEHFVDALPIPPTLKATASHQVTVTLGAFQGKMHRDLPAVTQWGYNGSSPGPTIEAERDHMLTVHWQNALPAKHFLPLPKGADVVSADVRAITHLHGASVAEPNPMDRKHNNDGWPDAWNVPGESQQADYPNAQTARTLWYHDHAMGTTGRNVAAGLIGTYMIHDAEERALNLPSGPYDIPLMLQSRQINDDGTLGYVDNIAKEFYGNAMSVNGKLWPYLNVEPRKYRFRVIDASNARSYSLTLVDEEGNAGPTFSQVASDSGFLAAPIVIDSADDSLILAPAERAEIVIDFAKFAGKTLTLKNDGRDPSDDEITLADVMQFRVGTTVSKPDTSTVPAKLANIVRIDPATAVKTRQIVFDQMTMQDGSTMQVLNGKHWHDPIEEKPVVNTTEVWELINTTIITHPFHVHLVDFQVVDRRLFDVADYLATGKVVYLAPAVAPDANEMGWKDVVRTFPQMVTRIVMRFKPFTGFYVYHCHILEHEDMDMMRPFQVISR